jgi:hypothetical protein
LRTFLISMKFFKKEGPRTPIVRKTGDSVKFETIDGNWGYYSTDDPALIEEFNLCIKQHRGALTEITEQQFEDEFSKKKPSSKPLGQPWREEFGGGPMGDTASAPRTKSSPAVVEAVAVAEKPLVTVNAPVPTRRNVGKRPIQ